MQEKKSPTEAADLTQIHGIGPGVARRLSDAGIDDLTALAVATPDTVAAALRGMPVVSNERIQEWIEAANRLAPPRADAADAPRDNGQHYATFRVELLLDPRNDVRRTRVSHVQSGTEENWAGWDGARLLRVVVDQAELQLPAAIPGETLAGEQTPAIPAQLLPAEPQQMAVRLHDLVVIDPQMSVPRRIVHRGQPYDVRFGVALEGGNDATLEQARMRATLYARSLGGEGRVLLGRAATARPLAPELDVAFAMTPPADLDPGPYRLEVELDMETEDRRQRWPTASLREGMVVVF